MKIAYEKKCQLQDRCNHFLVKPLLLLLLIVIFEITLISMAARPNSARQRAPVGKSNFISGNEEPRRIIRPRSAANFSRSSSNNKIQPDINQNERRQTILYNDGPSIIYSEPKLERKPTLPPSRFSTVPKPEEIPKTRYKRPLICPQSWLDNNAVDKDDIRNMGVELLNDKKVKLMLSRKFIEDNVNRLARFDPTYAGMTHQEVCTHMMNHNNFSGMLMSYRKREKVLNFSNSNQTKETFNDDGYNSLGEVKNDPFLASCTTPRIVRELRMSKLLTPSVSHTVLTANNNNPHRFRRGYRHVPEYGNFSAYNGLLVRNNCI